MAKSEMTNVEVEDNFKKQQQLNEKLQKTIFQLQRDSRVKDKRISQLNTNMRELQALVSRIATQLKST